MEILKNTESNNYMMESPDEAKRLSEKVNAEKWVVKYIKPFLDAKAPRILDIGCGSGALTNAIAQAFPSAHVIGLDASQDRIDHAISYSCSERINNVEFINGSADNLELADNSFDFVCSRFLLEYFKDPQPIADEMARVCKVGGKVFLQDIDYQHGGIYPEDDWPAEIEQVLEVMEIEGHFNRNIGRMLYSLIYKAGLKKEHISIEGYEIVAGKIDDEALRLEKWQLDTLFPVVEKILGSESKAKMVIEKLISYFKREDSFSFSLLISVVGSK